MALDLATFALKLTRVREMFDESLEAVSKATGIRQQRLADLEGAILEPTGDEVLILADHYAINFRFFISNEAELSVDRAEKLFRAYSRELSSADRLSIQEFLTLCENETFLLKELGRPPALAFQGETRGKLFKQHGVDAARKLRKTLGYGPRRVPDVFDDIRKLGIRVFRRRLANQKISGLFIQDVAAGSSVLVNYNEDVFRQRFTAAHEAAHALFDADEGFVVSFTNWAHDDLKEIRANAFAGAFLVSPELVDELPSGPWSEERFVDLAKQLQVNAPVLAIALKTGGKISSEEFASYKQLRIKSSLKLDPELRGGLTETSMSRKSRLLEQGLSTSYVNLCIEAFQREVISRGRMAEMLLVNLEGLGELFQSFGVKE